MESFRIFSRMVLVSWATNRSTRLYFMRLKQRTQQRTQQHKHRRHLRTRKNPFTNAQVISLSLQSPLRRVYRVWDFMSALYSWTTVPILWATCSSDSSSTPNLSRYAFRHSLISSSSLTLRGCSEHPSSILSLKEATLSSMIFSKVLDRVLKGP